MATTDIITEVHPTLGDSFDIVAFWRGYPAGQAYCIVKDHRLKIGDLKVPLPYRFPWRGFRWLRFPYTTVDCRRRGIGTTIMQRVLSEAARLGIVEVWGEIVDFDLARSPFLATWYERLGFTVSEPDSECDCERTVKKITKRM